MPKIYFFNNAEDAAKVLQGYTFSDEDFAAAIEYLKENDANNPVLADALKLDRQMLRELNAMYAVDEAVKEDDKAKLADIKAVLQASNDESVRGVAAGIADEEVVEKADKPVENEDDVAFEHNNEQISKIFDEVDSDTIINDDNMLSGQIMSRVTIVDDDNTMADEEATKEYLDTFVDAGKEEVRMQYAGDSNFHMQTMEQKKQQLFASLDQYLSERLGKVVADSAITEHEADETPEEFAAREEENRQNAAAAVENMLNGNDEIVVKKKALLSSILETAENMGSYVRKLFNNGKEKLGNIFSEYKQKLEAKAEERFGKERVTQVKTMLKAAADNRWRMGLKLAGSVAVIGTGLAFGTIPGMVAAAAYGAYAAADGKFGPLVTKVFQQRRLARENGGDASEWSWKNGVRKMLKKAREAIKANPQEENRYQRNKKIMYVAGPASAVLLAGGMFVGAGAVVSKAISSGARLVGANLIQGLDLKDAREAYLQNKEDAVAKNNYKFSKWMLGAAGLLSAASVGISLANAADVNTSDVNTTPADDNTAVVDQDVQANGKGGDTAINVTDGEPIDAVTISFPSEYDPSFVISEKHFNEIQEKISGILARRNEAFEQWNAEQTAKFGDDATIIPVKDPELLRDDMYNNIVNAMNDNPNLFTYVNDQGETVQMHPVQAMYVYMKLIGYTEIAKAGPKVDGIQYLVSNLDANGNPQFASMPEAMTALDRLVRCGEKFDIPVEEMNANMARIDWHTGAGLTKEFEINKTGNYFVGFGRDCPDGVPADTGTSMWRKGILKIKKIITHEKPAPKPVPQPIIEPEPKPDVPVKGIPHIEDKVRPDLEHVGNAHVTTNEMGSRTTSGAVGEFNGEGKGNGDFIDNMKGKAVERHEIPNTEVIINNVRNGGR